MSQPVPFFFATTQTSVWRAEALAGRVMLKKMKLRENARSAEVKDAHEAGVKLYIGPMLVLYTDPQTRGVNTSLIAGLFTRSDKADECLLLDNLQPLDPRCKDETISTLRLIGYGHPQFVICEAEDFRLLPPEEWKK